MSKVFIIAEAGVNHNGSFETAKRLVEVAKDCGADAIKFQTFKSELLVTKSARQADYQKNNMQSNTDNQFAMLKKLELSFDEFLSLQKYCDSIGIVFLSTPFDSESMDFLSNINVPVFKIPSGEITNLPLLMRFAKTNKELILSTGMCSIEEVDAALCALRRLTDKKITLLHCTTEYPAPMSEVNLNAMLTLKERFGLEVGYSDHTEGIEASIAAVALGATVIEKHFTLDKNMEGPDHKASLSPSELKSLVDAIRNTEKALGDGIKQPSKSEIKNRDVARKSIVAACNIKSGEFFTEDNLTVKRPGTGISPMKWYEILGTKATKDYFTDDLIEV